MDTSLPIESIQNKILQLRGQKVMLDEDLAELYGVETKVLNQAVKRHIRRFPSDFMFRLNEEESTEAAALRSQFVTLKKGRGQLIAAKLSQAKAAGAKWNPREATLFRYIWQNSRQLTGKTYTYI